ncbi:hypothetical protein [Phytohabitans kaempferiae]|uniref:hypothetical protein n=1 Tax=Phytohabitans kaempferiae TaxID=1620943 RepID=UPI003672DC20
MTFRGAGDFLDGVDDVGPLAAEPLGVQILDELGKRRLPRLLPVVVDTDRKVIGWSGVPDLATVIRSG